MKNNNKNNVLHLQPCSSGQSARGRQRAHTTRGGTTRGTEFDFINNDALQNVNAPLGQSARGRQRARTSRGQQRGTSRGMEYDVNNKVQITMQNSFLGQSARRQQRACSSRGRQRGSTSRGRGEDKDGVMLPPVPYRGGKCVLKLILAPPFCSFPRRLVSLSRCHQTHSQLISSAICSMIRCCSE